MRRFVMAAVLGAAVVGTAIPSLASSVGSTSSPVGVTVSTHGGVFVGTTIEGNPGLDVAVANNEACVAFSLEVPHCVSYAPIVDAFPGEYSVGPAHVFVSTAGGGVGVGTELGSQPLVGVQAGNGEVCVGFSLEVPFCVPLGHAPTNKAAAPRQSLPVVIYHDSNVTVVGVRDIGVAVYSDGRICPLVSTQTWQCTPAILG